MARIRVVKPGFWTDGRIIALSPFARLLYIGTWTFAMCDHGHVADDPLKLKLEVLPADDVDIHALLAELMDTGRIVRLTGPDGRTFLHVKRFEDHQKIDPRWKTRCPACTLGDSGELTETPLSIAETPLSSPKLPETHRNSLKDGMGWDGMGWDGMGITTLPAARAKTTPQPDRFPEFYDTYPRKAKRPDALKAWQAIARKPDADLEAVLAGAVRFAADEHREDQFTPYPATWLRNEGWRDPPCVPRQQPTGATRSTTDDRMAANLAFVQQLAHEDNPHRQIGTR